MTNHFTKERILDFAVEFALLIAAAFMGLLGFLYEVFILILVISLICIGGLFLMSLVLMLYTAFA
jgi:hypothetical protein